MPIEDGPDKPATDKWNLVAQRVAMIDNKYRWGQYILNRTEIKREVKDGNVVDIILYRRKPLMKFMYHISSPDKFTTEYL